MKNSDLHAGFVKRLKEKMASLKNMKNGDVHVFTISANYGRYKIMVGPLKQNNNFSLAIDGEIHHLFISPNTVRPNPSRHQIRDNLRHTVIMKGLAIHIEDPSGSGKKIKLNHSGVKPKECINFAGTEGSELLGHINSHGKLSRAAYNIIQEDIINSLRKKEKRV